jgi:hypothetical protein
MGNYDVVIRCTVRLCGVYYVLTCRVYYVVTSKTEPLTGLFDLFIDCFDNLDYASIWKNWEDAGHVLSSAF